jgi:hypothetical protein
LLSLLEKPKPLYCSVIHGLVHIAFPDHVSCVGQDLNVCLLFKLRYDILMHCFLKITKLSLLVPFTLFTLAVCEHQNKCLVCLPSISMHPETWRHTSTMFLNDHWQVHELSDSVTLYKWCYKSF